MLVDFQVLGCFMKSRHRTQVSSHYILQPIKLYHLKPENVSGYFSVVAYFKVDFNLLCWTNSGLSLQINIVIQSASKVECELLFVYVHFICNCLKFNVIFLLFKKNVYCII